MRFDASLPAYAGTRAGHLLLRRLTGFGLRRPPYRAHTNLVFLGELGDCRPMSVTIGNDPLLTGIKSLGAPKFLALLPGSLDTLIRALADQAALKLGNAAHDCQHQPAGIGRGIAPAFPKRYEAAGEAFQFVHDVVHVAAGTRQPPLAFAWIDHPPQYGPLVRVEIAR